MQMPKKYIISYRVMCKILLLIMQFMEGVFSYTLYGKEKWTVFNTHEHNNIKMLTLDIKQYISTKITVTVLFRKPDANAD